MSSALIQAVSAVLKVLLIVCSGAAIKHHCQTPRQTLSEMVKIGTNLFVPALIFTSITSGVTITIIKEAWVVIFSALTQALIISVFSYIIAYFFVPPKYVPLVVLTSTFCNGMIIPLSVIRGLADHSVSIKSQQEFANSLAFIYSSFQGPFFWSISPVLVEMTKKKVERENETLRSQQKVEQDTSRFVDISRTKSDGILHSDEEADTSEVTEKVGASDGLCEETGSSVHPMSDVAGVDDHGDDVQLANTTTKISRWGRFTKNPKIQMLSHAINAPLIATVMGLIVSVISPVREEFVSSTGWFNLPFSALAQVGEGAVPVILVILGANLLDAFENVSECKIPFQVILISLGTKLILTPLIYLLFSTFSHSLEVDPIVLLIIMIESSSPMAINCSLIFSMHNFMAQESAALTLYGYVMCIFTVSLWLTIFLSTLGL